MGKAYRPGGRDAEANGKAQSIMFGFGKSNERELLRQTVIDYAAKREFDDFRTLQRAITILRHDPKALNDMYRYVDDLAGALGDPNVRVSDEERSERERAADNCRNEALLRLHGWLRGRIDATIPADMRDGDTADRVIAYLSGRCYGTDTGIKGTAARIR